jgi:hypothetical protein
MQDNNMDQFWVCVSGLHPNSEISNGTVSDGICTSVLATHKWLASSSLPHLGHKLLSLCFHLFINFPSPHIPRRMFGDKDPSTVFNQGHGFIYSGSVDDC